MLASAFHTVLNGWDVIAGLAVVLIAIVMEKLVPPIPWVAWGTLFLVAMFGFALAVKW